MSSRTRVRCPVPEPRSVLRGDRGHRWEQVQGSQQPRQEDVRRVERVGSDSIACACANGRQYDKRSFSRKIVVAIRNFGVSFALSALLTGTLANAAPVALLKDINAETQARSSFPSYLGTVGAHTLFVTKAEADAELGLWRTDGTTAGTVRVAAETASTSFSTA